MSEKVVAKQLSAVLTDHILVKFQSGFCQECCTEIALVTVSNDIVMSSDVGGCSSSELLDLSAAFHPVDHKILIERVKH